MTKTEEIDEIEVVDLEEYSCSDRPIPQRVKYYLIRVDNEKIRVQSPIKASEVLIAAGLDLCDYRLIQKSKNGSKQELEMDQLIDLREPGVERFKTKLNQDITIIIVGREKKVDKHYLSYTEIINLHYEGNPPTGQYICFTVLYSNGPHQNPEGTLTDGQTVKLQCGMKFNVRTTDKS